MSPYDPIADVRFRWNKRGVTSDFDYTSTTVPPNALFVAADEPLLIYPSVIAAEQHLEAFDVDGGVYPAAYGPNGELFCLSTKGNVVVIEPTGGPNRPDELRALLLRYLEATGHAPNAKATLDHLATTAWAVESKFWQEHDPFGDRFAKSIPALGCLAFMAVMVVVLYFTFR